jgi:predicted AAA+ superfamily ATPase
MGQNSYSKAVELINDLKQRYGETISLENLRNEIKVKIGRTSIQAYCSFMNDAHLIKLIDANKVKFL